MQWFSRDTTLMHRMPLLVTQVHMHSGNCGDLAEVRKRTNTIGASWPHTCPKHSPRTPSHVHMRTLQERNSLSDAKHRMVLTTKSDVVKARSVGMFFVRRGPTRLTKLKNKNNPLVDWDLLSPTRETDRDRL
jgi:hypothetical protein